MIIMQVLSLPLFTQEKTMIESANIMMLVLLCLGIILTGIAAYRKDPPLLIVGALIVIVCLSVLGIEAVIYGALYFNNAR